MLRRMKVLLSAVASVLCLGLGSPALASGIFEEREPLIDREDLVEELILRERLFGQPFISPLVLSPFGVLSPFAFGRDALVLDLLLAEELIEEAEEEEEAEFEEELEELEDED